MRVSGIDRGSSMSRRETGLPSSESADALCCVPLSSAQLSEIDANEIASLFAALGDPVRLRLLSIVAAEGEVCSCNLEGPLGKSQPTISHHTRILAEAGLIVGEKRGKWTWWRTVPEQLRAVQRVLGGR